MNLAKYSKAIKILAILPVLFGFSNIADFILPSKTINTFVVSKKESTGSKFGNTTLSIDFENNNDQFTDQIYNNLNVGDKVILTVSALHEETDAVTKISTNQTFKNNTSEIYARLLITLVMLFPLIYIYKKYSLSSKQCKIALVITLISLGGFFRLLTTLF